jgi:hypothetical protein
MKKALLIFLMIIAASCKKELSQKLSLAYSDKNVDIIIEINGSDFSEEKYFGDMRLSNLSKRNISLNWGNKICLSDSISSHKVEIDYGYLTNQIASDFSLYIKSGESLSHPILILVRKNFDIKRSKVRVSSMLLDNDVILDLDESINGCLR